MYDNDKQGQAADVSIAIASVCKALLTSQQPVSINRWPKLARGGQLEASVEAGTATGGAALVPCVRVKCVHGGGSAARHLLLIKDTCVSAYD